MSHLANAASCLAATLQRVAGITGTYLSVNNHSVPMTGTLILRDYEILDDDGILTTLKSADWLFPTLELERFGCLPPQPGDQWIIDNYQNGKRATWHAMLLGKRPCFEAHDATEVMTVVHMKKVKNA